MSTNETGDVPTENAPVEASRDTVTVAGSETDAEAMDVEESALSQGEEVSAEPPEYAAEPEDPPIALSWLLEPISEELPCGPKASDDPDKTVNSYLIDAARRFPAKFLIKDPQTGKTDPFDTSVYSIADEREKAFAALAVARDLNVLITLAKFEMLCGELNGFADCLEAIAALAEAFPDHVHPQSNGDSEHWENLFRKLDDGPTVTAPLTCIELAGKPHLTLRGLTQAKTKTHPSGWNETQFVVQLGDERNHAALSKSYTGLKRSIEAREALELALMLNLQISAPSEIFRGLVRTQQQCLDLLEQADPSLAHSEQDMAEPDVPDAATDEQPAKEIAEEKPKSRPSGPAVTIGSRKEARQALQAVQTYFIEYETSSVCLPLVTQALSLIGQPMTEAVTKLAQANATQAFVRFDEDMPFQLNFDSLRKLTQAAMPERDRRNMMDEDEYDEEGAERFPEINERARIAPVLRGVELFFASAEVSSPVPMLLRKARSFLPLTFAQTFTELTRKAGSPSLVPVDDTGDGQD